MANEHGRVQSDKWDLYGLALFPVDAVPTEAKLYASWKRASMWVRILFDTSSPLCTACIQRVALFGNGVQIWW